MVHYIWPIGRLYQDYPQQVLVFNEYIWSAYHKICLYAFVVMFCMVILASCFYMSVKILLALAKRNPDLQMSTEFRKQIEQVSIKVIVNGSVYFLLLSVFMASLMVLSMSLTKYLPFSSDFWENISNLCLSINASINPLLYFLTNQRYRHAVKNLFR